MWLQTFCPIVRGRLTIDPFLRHRRPALQNILEKSVRELGGPLGGQKVDRSELKVESNQKEAEAITPAKYAIYRLV